MPLPEMWTSRLSVAVIDAFPLPEMGIAAWFAVKPNAPRLPTPGDLLSSLS